MEVGRMMGVAAKAIATLAVLGAAGWGCLFLWFRAPGGMVAAGALAILFAAGSVGTLVALWLRPGPWIGVWAAALVGLVVWYFALEPRGDRDWEPEVARSSTASIEGGRVLVRNVRNFAWRTETDFSPDWEDRTYDLDGLATLDLVNSYWTGPVIAHTLLSFGFSDGRFLTFSFEIRREVGEEYSALAGFVRQYELVAIAADDRDIIRLRTTARGEDVQIYRVRAEPAEIRAMFLATIGRADELARAPEWYNSLVANCTTELFRIARRVAPDLPPDWRIILSGYLPDYVYGLGRLDTRLTLDALRERASVGAKGRALGDDPDFARRIREGLPDPNVR